MIAWLQRDCCSPLPAEQMLPSASVGDSTKVPVFVLDDLATLERSRWQLWHDLVYGVFGEDKFLKIVMEERGKIEEDAGGKEKTDEMTTKKKTTGISTAVACKNIADLAVRILLQLVLDRSNPVEFVTELLVPATLLVTELYFGEGSTSTSSSSSLSADATAFSGTVDAKSKKARSAPSSKRQLADEIEKRQELNPLLSLLYKHERQLRATTSKKHFWLPDENKFTEFCTYFEKICPKDADLAIAMAQKQAENGDITCDTDCLTAVTLHYSFGISSSAVPGGGPASGAVSGKSFEKMQEPLYNLRKLFLEEDHKAAAIEAGEPEAEEEDSAAIWISDTYQFRWRKLKKTAERILKRHPKVPGVSFSLLRPEDHYHATGPRGAPLRCKIAQNITAGFAHGDFETISEQRVAVGAKANGASRTSSTTGTTSQVSSGRRQLNLCYNAKENKTSSPDSASYRKKSFSCVRSSSATTSGSNSQLPLLEEEEDELEHKPNLLRPGHKLQIASLSKTIAAAMALEHFKKEKINVFTTSVNEEFRRIARKRKMKLEDTFQLQNDPSLMTKTSEVEGETKTEGSFAESVKICHLMNHCGLGMHYVFGLEKRPRIKYLLDNLEKHKYDPEGLIVTRKPGSKFQYSGGGFLVLQLLLEFSYDDKPIGEILRTEFLAKAGGNSALRKWNVFSTHEELLEASTGSFGVLNVEKPNKASAGTSPLIPAGIPEGQPPKIPPGSEFANGYKDDGSVVSRLFFPELAAGGECSCFEMAGFLADLCNAYNATSETENDDVHQRTAAAGAEERSPSNHYTFPISHDTAVQMLYTDGRLDNGCQDFMKSDQGLGTFVTSVGPNKVACHQAANDGFRGLYLVCLKGPDCGKGIVLVSNGDNAAVPFNCELVAEVLRIEGWTGLKKRQENAKQSTSTTIAASSAAASFDVVSQNLKQAEIVNQGLKQLLFEKHFQEDLPADNPTWVKKRRKKDVISEANVISPSTVKILKCSDQRFSRVSNLFNSQFLPVFELTAFGPDGKIMDSWETKRHCTIEEGDFVRFSISGNPQQRNNCFNLVYISTIYHDGNHAPGCDLRMVDGKTGGAIKSLFNGKIELQGHSAHWIYLPEKIDPCSADDEGNRTVFEFRNIPDGGISRLGFFNKDYLLSRIAQLAKEAEIGAEDPEQWADYMGFMNWYYDLPKKPAEPEIFRARYKFEIGNQQKEHDDATLDKENSETSDVRVSAAGNVAADLTDSFAENVRLSAASDGASKPSLSKFELVKVTNQHYGKAERLFSSDPPLGMHDGFETKRTREVDGFQEAVFRVPHSLLHGTRTSRQKLSGAEFDFTYFVNNNPSYVELLLGDSETDLTTQLVPKTFSKPYRGDKMVVPITVQHEFEEDSSDEEEEILAQQFVFIAVRLFPCGGVNRLKFLYNAGGS
ncbi:unnamed protein product [Amoebophrya sp. A120]|nr:unnamed protein product [Amoebophrya sp. A120]|eukprot:GSA120T00007782001.1